MQRKTRRIIAAVAVVGALAAGGAAFTAANGFNTTDTAGYGSTSVSGATIADQVNNLSSDGTEITSVDLTFTTSQTGNTVKAMFSDDAAGMQACTSTNPAATPADTTWNCPTPNALAGGANGNELTASASNFAVAVTNN